MGLRQLIKKVRRVKKKVLRSMKRLSKRLFFNFLYPAYYRHCAKQPVKDDKVVFAELMTSVLTDNFRLIYEMLEENYHFDLEVLLLNQHKMRYRKKAFLNFSIIKSIATARYVFIANTFPVITACPIRPETSIVQTWHACGAFKRFGYSLLETGSDSEKSNLIHAHYTHVFVSGPEAVAAYAEAFGMENEIEKIIPTGVSRTDVFWNKEFIDSAMQEVQEKVPASVGKKIILYAPTYRNNVTHAKTPNDLSIAVLCEKFSDEYVLLIKRHPYAKKEVAIPLGCEDFAFDISDEIAIEQLIIASDICISDYSSLVFEFSLTGRQILFFVPDLDEYYDVRGFYYDFADFACGPICKTTDEIIMYLGNETQDDIKCIQEFKKRFMDGCDGNATQRIIEAVFGQALDAYK